MKNLLWLLLMAPMFPEPTPDVYRVKVDTTVGSFIVEAHRDWAPHGANRFYDLVQAHYYDDSRFFRVVPGKWVQFGSRAIQR